MAEPQPRPTRQKRRQPRERKARPVTEDWLERAALHYLERFSATRARLIDVLERKARRRAYDQPLPDQLDRWIDAVADKCVRLGYIDDAHYAASRARSMLARGKPLRMIAQDLRVKGVAADLIDDAIAALGDGDARTATLQAAVALARRRRFGAYAAQRLSGRVISFDKQMAAMMRAGFPYDLSRRVLEADDPESLEAD